MKRPYRMIPRTHPLLRIVQDDRLKLRRELEPRDPSWLVAVYGITAGSLLTTIVMLLATC